MQDPTLDTEQYRDHLDSFLRQLKDELDIQGRAVITPVAGQDSLDEYLLELNSFYYESFHQRFFPLYNQIIEEDIRNLYHISQQEAVLKKNIMANFKQYARLFNQVKNISALLKGKRQETQSLAAEYQQRNDERSVNLLYVFKDLASNWDSFRSVLSNLQIMLDDKKLLTALQEHPTHVVVSNLIEDWKPDGSKAVRDFNRLLAAWQLAVKLLVKFQDNPSPTQETLGLLADELYKIDTSWDNRRVPPTIRTWYQQYIQRIFRLYLESLSLSGEKRSRKHTAQTAGYFADWLNSLLDVVEQSMVYKARGWDHLINQLGRLAKTDKEYIKELDVYTSRFLQSIEELIESLASSSRANYQNHSQRGSGLLAAASQYLQQQIESTLTTRGIILVPDIKQLRTQINFLESRIELLDEQEEHSVNASGQYQAMADSLDSFLELLRNVKEELNRMLSPHYIKNSFQNLDLRIEHVAIATGSLLPTQYNYLIDEMAIGTEGADAPPGRILYEEGDIFIIHLNELTETEIPKIIIAKKG